VTGLILIALIVAAVVALRRATAEELVALALVESEE